MTDNLHKELLSIVDSINKEYVLLKEKSNDTLRDLVSSYKSEFRNSDDIKVRMDKALISIFAIIKETARRFSVGDIIVNANENDLKLAEKFDFVTIADGKATYHSQWRIMGELQLWDMIHYDEQLMAGILLHRGYAIEMATGEGKTLAGTLPIFLNALSGNGVHVFTVNEYLSKRDCEQMRPLFMFYGLSVDCIEYYPNHDIRRKKAYNSDITYGTNSSFTFDYLYDHLAVTKEECVQNKHSYAIIDELDSILIDEADEPHIIGGGNLYDVGEDYVQNKSIIEELIQDKSLYDYDPIKCNVCFTSNGKLWLAEKLQNRKLFTIDRLYEVNNYKKLSKEELFPIQQRLNLQNVLYQLLKAYVVLKKDVDYIVSESQKIIIIDQHTGRRREHSRWEYGLHTAVEVKEGVQTQFDNDATAVISLKNYFALYDKKAGMSGTIMTVAKELKKAFDLDCAVIPTHKPLIRLDYPNRIFKTKEGKDHAIVEFIKQVHNESRPILVGSRTIKRAEEICNLLRENNIDFTSLTAKTDRSEARVISQAGKENAITISTSIAGRGTDIKLSNESKSHGGLVVIGTDIFDSIRIDRQLKGRAGRQGDPGTSAFFVSLEDLIIKNLSDEDQKTLYDISNKEPDEELHDSKISGLIDKSQREREDYCYELRTKVALKDDVIAPHRKDFYNKRNKILFDSKYSNEIIEAIESSEDALYIDKHLRELYDYIYPIVLRVKENNKLMETIPIPFSESKHLFCVKLNIDKALNSYAYFKEEFQRQMILHAYDSHWKKFVLHLMSNLDQNQVNHLIEDFSEMTDMINNVILLRLRYAAIPVNRLDDEVGDSSEDMNDVEDSSKHTINRHTEISPDSLCPCGSGKKYSECHGQNNRYIRRRRIVTNVVTSGKE